MAAELPGLAKPGQKIDVNVSAIGKASSLRGGNLLLTSLRGVDGQVYALSQGPVNTTGVAESAAGSKVTIGVPTSTRIPRGATVERSVDTPFERSDQIVLNLREADFTTTRTIVDAINGRFGPEVARAIDAVSVVVRAPADLSQRVAFVSDIENIEITPGEPPARVVVNSRTGTVVINDAVRLSPAAVSHGELVIRIEENPAVIQPAPFSRGETAVEEATNITV